MTVAELLPERAVVVITSADADGDVETAAGQLVEGADLLGNHGHRVLGKHPEVGHDAYALGHRGTSPERRDHLGIAEGDSLAGRNA